MVLEPGAALVLYTDGLVERRNLSIDERMQQLADVLSRGADSAADLVDEAVDRMLPMGPPNDDVALIAVKRSNEQGLHIRMPAQSTSLAPVRGLMRRWLSAQGAAADETNDIVLAIGELASNACIHASPMVIGTFSVDARMVDGVIHVVVGDQGHWRPPYDRGGGRGLTIVRAMVDSLSIDTDDHGTRAHIERALTSQRIEASAK